MKTKILWCVMLAFSLFYGKAQTDYTKYLNDALKCLEEGNCEKAQRWYNVYVDLTNDKKPSVKEMIEDCINEQMKNKVYAVGDTMMVDNKVYTVAFIREGGKHGLAVKDSGWHGISSDKSYYVTQQNTPTLEELKQIYGNRDYIGLYNKYWTRTENEKSREKKSSGSGYYYYYYVIDFSTGTQSLLRGDKSDAIILLVHRF